MKKSTNLVKNFVTILTAVSLICPAISFSAEKAISNSASSKLFIAFEDAAYHTSPDKRIGAKILADPAKVGPSMSSLVHLTYLPGAHIDSHRHVYVTEVLYVLEGNLTLRIGEEIKILGPNSTAYIPAKSFHEYLNDSTDVVKFLQYYSPSGPEEEYRNWEKPAAVEVTPQPVKGEPKKTEAPAHIIAPTLPPIPGSPEPVLGTVSEGTGSENKPAANFELKVDKDK
ncbi:MAG: cupin domain-containing protein [Candidatus Riflebacteria bacterium]|nr:cupin domain-containing protein [Candidatus Riflebacteria bacterium]